MSDVLQAVRKARFWYQDGLSFRNGEFELPSSAANHFRSCYVFSFPKAGSVFLNNLVCALMREADVPVIDLPSMLFAQGVSTQGAVFDLKTIFRPRGYCYCGFRSLLPVLCGNLPHLTGPKVFMVRDPRDMLVSLYYSLKFSHTFPTHSTPQFNAEVTRNRALVSRSIDDFCLALHGSYQQLFHDYRELLDDPELHVYRYEDVVFKKDEFAGILCRLFSITVDPQRLEEIVREVDIIPGTDRPGDHVRQVYPGDHKRKLRTATIRTISASLGDFLDRFEYPR